MSSSRGDVGEPAARPARREPHGRPVRREPLRLGPVRSDPVDDATLVDLLDRVIDRGVVVAGDIVLSVAGVDLVHVGVRLVIRGLDGPLE